MSMLNEGTKYLPSPLEGEERISTRSLSVRNSGVGFTLAEVLITLGIIGVVAAMTLPTLINDIKYHSYDGAKRKILNSVGEAGRLLAIEGDITGAADAEDFVKNRLSKKLSIAKMCDSAHLTDCGLPAKFYKTNGKTEMSMPTKMKGQTATNVFNEGSDETKAYATKNSYGFVTGNGYSVNLFYNGACEPVIKKMFQRGYNYYTQNHICFWAIYDMNGQRGPNTFGKDIGLVGVFYPDEETRAVAVLPSDYDYSSDSRGGERTSVTFANAVQKCDEQFGIDYRLPDRDELALMSMAGRLFDISSGVYWSSTTVGTGLTWRQEFYDGKCHVAVQSHLNYLHCVRR